jgi:hypothetical protein
MGPDARTDADLNFYFWQVLTLRDRTAGGIVSAE